MAENISPDNGANLPALAEAKLAEYERKLTAMAGKLEEMQSKAEAERKKAAFAKTLAGYNLEERAEELIKLIPSERLVLSESGGLSKSEEIISLLKEKLPELFSGRAKEAGAQSLSAPPSSPKVGGALKALTFEEVRRLAAERYKNRGR